MRALEESLRRSDKLAAVGRLAAGLAHEIRNPLGSMSSALQFVQEKVPPGTDEASMMDVVLRESRRLNNIIANFLAYARPSSDGFVADDTAYIDVGETIRDCIALLRHSPEFTDAHTLTFDLPADPIRLDVSETKIKQVLWNLLQNSIQAMPDGGDLSIALDAASGSNLQIHHRRHRLRHQPGKARSAFRTFFVRRERDRTRAFDRPQDRRRPRRPDRCEQCRGERHKGHGRASLFEHGNSKNTSM